MKGKKFLIGSIIVLSVIALLAVLYLVFPRQVKDVTTEVTNQEPIETFVFETCPGGGESRVEKLYRSEGDDLEAIKRRAAKHGSNPLDECVIPVRYELYP